MLKKCLRVSLRRSLSSACKFWIRAGLLRNPVFCTCLSLSCSKWQSSFWAVLPKESLMLVYHVRWLNNQLCSASDPQDFDKLLFFLTWPAFYFAFCIAWGDICFTPALLILLLGVQELTWKYWILFSLHPQTWKKMYHLYSFCLEIQQQR